MRYTITLRGKSHSTETMSEENDMDKILNAGFH